jgi:chemotaxis protein methyltransferase CheR
MSDVWAPPVPEIQATEFEQIRNMARSTFGLDLKPGKEHLVSSRLARHVRSGGFRSFQEYLEYVRTDISGESLLALIDALTTHHTSFFREPEHFRILADHVLPGLPRNSVTIWSAACSTGEEAYSILFTALEARQAPGEVRVIGTDVSNRVLETAHHGVYSFERLATMPPGWVNKYFERCSGRERGLWQVRPSYRSMVAFRRLNLMEALPRSFRFPVIFCRNVLIYFDRHTQQSVVDRLSGAIKPGGFLFTGHAESLTGINHQLRYVKPSVYQGKA